MRTVNAYGVGGFFVGLIQLPEKSTNR